MSDYTTTGLLRNLKRRGFIPSGSGLTTSDLLEVASEQLRTYIPAFLKGLREEFIIAQLAITVTAPTVPIPVRACGVALRSIGWTCSDGSVRQLTRIEPERRNDWALSGSEPQGFMFQGNSAILIPAVSSGTLVVSYQQRPGELVLPTDCCVVASWVSETALSVSGTLPTSFAVGAICDVVRATPNFDLLGMDCEITGLFPAGPLTTVQLSSAPEDTVEGDYLCMASETPIPRLPLECFDLLAQATAFQIASDTGSERLPAIKLGLDRVEQQVTAVLSPRSDSTARVIVNRSGIGRRGF